MEPSEPVDETTTIIPEPQPESSRRDNLFLIAISVSMCAILVAVMAVNWSWRAMDENEAGVATQATGETAMVSLSEFKVTPVTIGAGGSLMVMNEGTSTHNLAIEGTDLKTADIAAGGDETLELGDLKPGSYTMICQIPGHKDAGMKADLTVTAARSSEAATATTMDMSGDSMDYDAMTKAMTDSMGAYPAETKGVGNAILQPSEVRTDGTKVFDLDAKIADWERAPGDVVQAWTYNGTVPAPSIHVNVGDKVEFRLKNDLPIGTDLHLHGLNVDNQFDGVAPLTQDLIEPGATFTYKYTADEVAVAMYHPHFMSQVGMPNGMFGTIFVGQEPTHAGQTVGGEVIPADVTVAQEFPMVLNDSGVIGLSLNGKSFPATAPIVANTGDWVMFHYFNEGSQTHPMHLHQFDQIVVAKDGYPLDHPYVADVVNVGPGERYTVLVKLDKAGTWVWHCHILPHVEDDNGMFGMVTAVVVK